MSFILGVHEPDVRGEEGHPGESTEYASDGCHFLRYLQCLSLWCSFDYEGSIDGVGYPHLSTSEGLR